MPLTNWLAIAAAVAISVLVALFATPAPASAPTHAQAPQSFASLGTVPNLPSLPLPAATAATTSAVTATAATTSIPAPARSVAPSAKSSTAAKPSAAAVTVTTRAAKSTVSSPSLPAATIPSIAPIAIPSESTSDLDTTVGLVRNALVNIICDPSAPNLRAASASGVIIDPRGVILTVAHMAQYFLLTDYPSKGGTQCVIRTGSPAQNAYLAKLIFISPDWIKNNPSTLIEAQPTGTGESDFALLAITGSATSAPLPSSFPSIPLSVATPSPGDAVTIGSYGAEFLATKQIEDALYPIIVFGSITDRLTFATSTVDLISVEHTAAAQEGSSGGAVVDSTNAITGLITTSSVGTTDVTTRTLHATTPGYLRRDFLQEMGKPLDSYLSGSTLSALVQQFQSESHDLSSILESHLH